MAQTAKDQAGRAASAGVAGGKRQDAGAPKPAEGATGPFRLDPLPFAPDRHEPYIDAETFLLHHDKHHATYVANLNKAAAELGALAHEPLEKLLAHLGDVPDKIQQTVRNNAGGHANHTMFWQIMGGDGGEPAGSLKSAIERDFGGLEALQERLNAAGAALFGSGWVFVTVDKGGKLALVSKPNQDTPLMDGQRVLLGNDVWEHAYYLKYQNRRADYLKAWWHTLNWPAIGRRYDAARDGALTI